MWIERLVDGTMIYCCCWVWHGEYHCLNSVDCPSSWDYVADSGLECWHLVPLVETYDGECCDWRMMPHWKMWEWWINWIS